MSLAATGALTSVGLAAVYTGANSSGIAVSSAHGDASQSSFAMAESHPKYKIIPVPGGMLLPAHSIMAESSLAGHSIVPHTDFLQPVEAGVATDGLGVIGALLLVSAFPFAMNFFTRTANILAKALKSTDSTDTPSTPFVPFVRRGDNVSPYNPVRIGGEELPGRAIEDPHALSNMFGKKGIQ